jgi:LysR family transcriptional regulator, glycine cleavage system transcriptional activator
MSASAVTVEDRKPPPFAALRAFEAVGRLGGVRRAAQALKLDHAVVSRHLRTLETWSGVALVDRTRSGALLTQQGQRYHARIAIAFAEINAATGELLNNAGAARLRLWCVPGFAFRWLMARIGSFCAEHPDVEFELHPTDVSPDFGHDQADADLRYVPGYRPAPPAAPNVRTIEIDRPVVMPVASPDYLASLREPITQLEDLLKLPLLHEESYDYWHAWFSAQSIDSSPRLSGPRLWHAHLTVEAACRGQGIALANHFLFRDDMATGRIVPVRIGGQPPPQLTLGTYLFSMRNELWDTPSAARFRKWLRKAVIRHRQALNASVELRNGV